MTIYTVTTRHSGVLVRFRAPLQYLCTSKTKGSTNWTTKNERGPGQRHSNKENIKPDRTKDNIFLKPKDDRTYGEQVDDRLEAGYGELRSDSERRSQDGGSNGTTWGDIITKENLKKCTNRGVERRLTS